MNDICTILADSAAQTQKAGSSLSKTLYGHSVTVALTGPLGAGKTTFLQGFASSLGVREPLTSPTYALEQRYETPRGPFSHLDLYRLTDGQASELLHRSEDADGIRCIEWTERVSMPRLLASGPVIHVDVQEGKGRDDRVICIAFHDAAIPEETIIAQWRKDVLLPPHIAAHCDAVAGLCDRFAGVLMGQSHVIRTGALRASGQVHDLFRFLDFRPGGHPDNDHGPEQLSVWEGIRKQYPGLHHEAACAQFLQERGFSALSSIVAVHGLSVPPPPDATIEQKLLFYADKRVMLDRVVTLDERFADFAERYGKGVVSDVAKEWFGITRKIEQDLFADGPPF
ncbi:MAG: tRNA (adenosine(37)-N6)-threonylcarbamoyltransferase complex ATPase subunit type 1 TsaE [Candidatus Peribacteraceae bacterium]|nr:tRNA (adenosine(37)-N6)-threonylcarbamoyltransferase complex ATPase subunit type 1 TsaE [Candidatus Peribacteraceae bacterium]